MHTSAPQHGQKPGCILLFNKVEIFTKRFFCENCCCNSDAHENDTGYPATRYIAIKYISQVFKQQKYQGQSTPYHVWNCNSSSSPKVSAKLFRTHRYIYNRKSRTITQART